MQRPSTLRPLATLLLGISLAGCIKTWQPSPVGPVETIATNPDRVMLTLADSSTVVLHEPRIEEGEIVSPDGRARLDSVLVVQTRQANIFANVVVYGVAAMAATYLIAWTFWGSELDLPP
jgi:hypothetical protein